MISLRNISKSFSSNKVLSDISFDIPTSQTVIIGGSNGSGKSLLMKIIAGLEKPTSGTVSVSDKPGLVIQDADAQILGDTVLEDVLFGLGPKDMDKALKALEKTGLLDKKDFPARVLSGGEKRRLAVASVIALDRRTVIFDEPYSNLDYQGVVCVNRVIRDLQKEHYTIIILSHELDRCPALADRLMVLHKGDITFDGKPGEALKLNLETWGIRTPSGNLSDMVWL